jgi:hypothetical protein
VTGALAKLLLARGAVAWPSAHDGGPGRCGRVPALPPSRVLSVSIMPCFDKKLEASRRDFLWGEGEGGLGGAVGPPGSGNAMEGWGEEWREVDLVLSAGEVAELVREAAATHLRPVQRRGTLYGDGGSSSTAVEGGIDLEALLCSVVEGGALAGASASNIESDGYLAWVYRATSAALLGRAPAPHEALPFIAGRNADMRELSLAVPTAVLAAYTRGSAAAATSAADGGGVTTLTFAAAYGFRNIQGVVSKLKKAGSGAFASSRAQGGLGGVPYAYVEVMACPGGCTNGGGQVKLEAEAATAVEGGGNALLAASAAGKARAADVGRLHALRSGAQCSVPRDTVQRLLAAVPLLTCPTQGASGGPLTPEPALWRALLRTRFHAVPALVENEAGGLSGSALKW